MANKIIIPSNDELLKYGKMDMKNKKLETLHPDVLKLWSRVTTETANEKWAKNKIKKIFKIYKSWKEEVIDIINNTDYTDDQR
jgi:hypothetical protein